MQCRYDFTCHKGVDSLKHNLYVSCLRDTGYSPGIAVIGDHIVGIENRDSNTNVRFHQQDTLERIFTRLENNGIFINRARMDCGSCSEDIVDMVKANCNCNYFYIRSNRCSAFYDDIQEIWEGGYTYRCILTNDFDSDVREIVEFYNLRGGKERISHDMNNGFGWKRLPKSFMAENTVYLLMTALVRNFYKTIVKRMNVKDFGLSTTSRIKTFVFKFISVPAKWIKTSREYRLNIYTVNTAYARVFNASD